MPDATNTPSRPPWRETAASTMAAASAGLSGRRVTSTASSMPSSARPAALPPARVSRAPPSASARAATLPNAPVAPVISIDLPCTLNRSAGVTVGLHQIPAIRIYIIRYVGDVRRTDCPSQALLL